MESDLTLGQWGNHCKRHPAAQMVNARVDTRAATLAGSGGPLPGVTVGVFGEEADELG